VAEVVLVDVRARWEVSDPVNHPTHYTAHASGVEAIEICSRLDFVTGNAVKYLFRAGLKDPVLQDLQKAAWYLRYYKEKFGNSATLFPSKAVISVLRAEASGSLLGDVLQILVSDSAGIPLALARVEREIERVQEGR
jgi:hypothetical protein